MTTFQRTSVLEAYRDLTNQGATKPDAIAFIADAYGLRQVDIRETVEQLYPEPQRENA